MRSSPWLTTLYSVIHLLSIADSQRFCYPKLTASFTGTSSISATLYSTLSTNSSGIASLSSSALPSSSAPTSNPVPSTGYSTSTTSLSEIVFLPPFISPTSSTPPTDSSLPPTRYSSSITTPLAFASLSFFSLPPSPFSTGSISSNFIFSSSSASTTSVASIFLSTFFGSSLQSAIDAGHSSLIFGQSHDAGATASSTTISSRATSILVGVSSRSTSSTGSTGSIALSTSSMAPASSSDPSVSSQQPTMLPTSNRASLQAASSTPSSLSAAPRSNSTSIGTPSLSSLSSGTDSTTALSTPTSTPLISSLQLASGLASPLSTYESTTFSKPVVSASSTLESRSSSTQEASRSPLSASSVLSTTPLRSIFASYSSTSAISTGPGQSTNLPTRSTLLASSTNVNSLGTSPSTSTSTAPSTPTLNPGPGKRGLVYGNNTYTNYFALAGQNSRVSWAYNYFSLPDAEGGGLNPALTFVPMLFNDAPALTAVFAANVNASIAQYGTDSILSFNEPDSCFGGSACMSVDESVAAYRAYIQPFAGRVLLGAPAVTNGGPPGSLTYLTNFLGNCTGCTIDFVPIHWYASAYNEVYFQQYIAQAYSISGGKPLWVTEFGMDQDYYDPDVQTFIKASLTFLDNTTYVQRYAYFGAYPGDLKNNFSKGLLISNDGTRLSAEGLIFNNYTGF